MAGNSDVKSTDEVFNGAVGGRADAIINFPF